MAFSRKTTSSHKATFSREVEPGTTAFLPYQPPYRFSELLTFFASRALDGVERINEGTYARVVRLALSDGGEAVGWVRVEDDPDPCRNRLIVTMSNTLELCKEQVLARVRYMFDVECDPQQIACDLAPLEEVVPGALREGTRLPGCFDPFETACRAVLGQQISVAAANKMAARIVKEYGKPVETGIAGLERAWPTPVEMCALEPLQDALGPLGVIGSRSRALGEIARLLVDGELDFDAVAAVPASHTANTAPPESAPHTAHTAPPEPAPHSSSASHAEEQMARLMNIKGIGPWTANYIAMRVMSFPDAFLETDAGVKHALPNLTPAERLKLAESWRPWRSYAVVMLWNSLVN